MRKKFFFSIVVFIAVLAILEGAARLAERAWLPAGNVPTENIGWQTQFFSSIFDWHEPDPDLLWRFRANLDNPLINTNSAHLVGDEITTEKPPGIFRILLLGDSSPIGIGLTSRRQALGNLLQSMLDVNSRWKRQVQVINAAVSGYTSEQIVRFLDLKGWSYQPDLVLLYCGSNDASISGPLSDQELLQGQRLKAVRRLMSRLAVYRLLRALIQGRVDPDDTVRQPLKVRVSPERFGENLRTIAAGCRTHGCPLLVLKPPVPLLWPAGLQFKAFTHVTGKDGQVILPRAMLDLFGQQIRYCLSDSLFAELYGRGDMFTRAVYLSASIDSLEPLQAVEHYLEQQQTDPENPILTNNLGVSLWECGRYRRSDTCLRRARDQFVKLHGDIPDALLTTAGSTILYNIGINALFELGADPSLLQDTTGAAYCYLDSALQSDYFSLRIKDSYCRHIDQLAAQSHVTIVDLPAVFRENGGERLFIDHCHPTAEGHRLIAQELFRVICQTK